MAKFAYVHIPKTGGNYVQWAFNYDLWNLGHKSVLDYDVSGYTTFTTIRNPFALLVSWYTHVNGGQDGLDNCNKVYGFKSFDQFIRAFCDPNFELNRPKMNDFLFWQIFDGDKIVVDCIIRSEVMDLGLSDLYEGVRKGPKINSSNDDGYRKFYTDETRMMVEKKCKRELDIFGYGF